MSNDKPQRQTWKIIWIVKQIVKICILMLPSTHRLFAWKLSIYKKGKWNKLSCSRGPSGIPLVVILCHLYCQFLKQMSQPYLSQQVFGGICGNIKFVDFNPKWSNEFELNYNLSFCWYILMKEQTRRRALTKPHASFTVCLTQEVTLLSCGVLAVGLGMAWSFSSSFHNAVLSNS